MARTLHETRVARARGQVCAALWVQLGYIRGFFRLPDFQRRQGRRRWGAVQLGAWFLTRQTLTHHHHAVPQIVLERQG